MKNKVTVTLVFEEQSDGLVSVESISILHGAGGEGKDTVIQRYFGKMNKSDLMKVSFYSIKSERTP